MCIYIARMDADDICRPERLALQADFLDREPGIGLVGGRVEYLGDAKKNEGLAHFVRWSNSLIAARDISLYRFVESPLIHPSVMFRRALPERFGPYRDGPFPEDYVQIVRHWIDNDFHDLTIVTNLQVSEPVSGRATRW